MILAYSRRFGSTLLFDLGDQIKKLNDLKQFKNAIALFDKHDRSRQSNPIAMNQALRACIELGDFQKGKDIHRQLSPYLMKNSFVRTSLIRLYSM